MATLCSSRSKDDLQPRKYFFFIHVLFVLHVFYIPFNLCESEYYIEGEIVQCKIYFLTYHYVYCRFITETSWRINC